MAIANPSSILKIETKTQGTFYPVSNPQDVRQAESNNSQILRLSPIPNTSHTDLKPRKTPIHLDKNLKSRPKKN